MISVRLNYLSLKYQRFTTNCCNDIGIRKFDFVARTQFLWDMLPVMKEVEFPGKMYD